MVTPPQQPAERVRQHWRERYGALVKTLPISDAAHREGYFREANEIAPCKAVGGSSKIKTGARDAAIWLTAVAYAHAHPHETIYFVSENIKDFGDGTSLEPAMAADISGLEDRFVVLTSLADVLSKFARETETVDAELLTLLNDPVATAHVADEAKKAHQFSATLAFAEGLFEAAHCTQWMKVTDVSAQGVSQVRAFEIAG
ncbi:PIN domain-containing protein [Streptomyces sp. NPDC001941]|uniref:PIN domain-containing protein n=1 Tax=Streptomyces sp. NPDC001941 TaxID=3154659 RepID=UPI00332A4174